MKILDKISRPLNIGLGLMTLNIGLGLMNMVIAGLRLSNGDLWWGIVSCAIGIFSFTIGLWLWQDRTKGFLEYRK